MMSGAWWTPSSTTLSYSSVSSESVDGRWDCNDHILRPSDGRFVSRKFDIAVSNIRITNVTGRILTGRELIDFFGVDIQPNDCVTHTIKRNSDWEPNIAEANDTDCPGVDRVSVGLGILWLAELVDCHQLWPPTRFRQRVSLTDKLAQWYINRTILSIEPLLCTKYADC